MTSEHRSIIQSEIRKRKGKSGERASEQELQDGGRRLEEFCGDARKAASRKVRRDEEGGRRGRTGSEDRGRLAGARGWTRAARSTEGRRDAGKEGSPEMTEIDGLGDGLRAGLHTALLLRCP